MQGYVWRARRELNPDLRLRRPASYPLDHGRIIRKNSIFKYRTFAARLQVAKSGAAKSVAEIDAENGGEGGSGMAAALHILYAALYAALAGYGLKLWRAERGGTDWRYLLLIVTAALIWDNAVLGLGSRIGAGPALKLLNEVRYWLHALATPLLALVAVDLIRKAGAAWAATAAARGAALLYTALLIGFELFTSTFRLQLVPQMERGVLQYVDAGAKGAPWMVVFVMIPVTAAAYYLWKYRRSWAPAAGIAVMAAGSAAPALGVPIGSGAWMNALELALTAGLWAAVGATAKSAGPAAA